MQGRKQEVGIGGGGRQEPLGGEMQPATVYSLWFDSERSYAMLTARLYSCSQGAAEAVKTTHILRLLITPFSSVAPFKNTSLPVAVHCQAVEGAAWFLLISLLPLVQCVNVKCVQSLLTALLGFLRSVVFELAGTATSLSISPGFQLVLPSKRGPAKAVEVAE